MNLFTNVTKLTKGKFIIKLSIGIILIIYGMFTFSLIPFLFGVVFIIENAIQLSLNDKFKRKYFILKYGVFILIIITLYFLAENRARKNDQFELWENKIILPYLVKSYLPNDNKFVLDNYEINLPFGYSIIDDNFSISIMSNTFLNILPLFVTDIIYNNFEKELNEKFIFIDNLGSMRVWKETEGERLLYFVHKRRGGIDYLYATIK